MNSCPFCNNKYKADNKNSLYTHIETEHPEQLKGLSPAQIFFNYKNKKSGGNCVICNKPTKFNIKTEKYERLCSPECASKYREQFKNRMLKKYGKIHLLNEPEKQIEMLKNRKIAKDYIWQNGYKHTVIGSFEYDFLFFLEHMMQWQNPEDIICPSPEFFIYIGSDKLEHTYIPDFYIGSINLFIEIKSSENKHYRLRDVNDEMEKDKAIVKSLNKDKHSAIPPKYVKLFDKEYTPFINYLIQLKE
jgi:hypothetical protein